MEVHKIEVMPLGTNCYFAFDEGTRDGIVIDPGGSSDLIMKKISELNMHVVSIVDTHGHWDHVGANDAISAQTGAPVYIHEDDADYLTDPAKNISNMMGTQAQTRQADHLLKEGDTVTFGGCSLQVIHTPGHTPGGICLYGHGILFCGDTLFYRSIGRTDLPGGDFQTLVASIKNKIFVLPGDTMVCPGHGMVTNVRDEINGNPFVR